jgi:hypothetical protein
LQGKTAAIDHILLSKYGSIFYRPFNFLEGSAFVMSTKIVSG